MRRPRWKIQPKPGSLKPVIYLCVSRVVNRDFVFDATEKEQLRKYMRMYEGFSGNRVHDLSEFMKSFVQRYTQWHNGERGRGGDRVGKGFCGPFPKPISLHLRHEIHHHITI